MKRDLKEVIDKYAGLVNKVAFFNLNNISDLDDVVQDVYLKVYDNLDKIDDDKFKQWLGKVTRNTAKNYNKRFWRRNIIGLEEDTCLINKEFLEEIMLLNENIKSLNETYKETFLMYVRGYTSKEISKKLKITEDCVRKRIERAREIIKDDIFEEGENIWIIN